MSENTYQEFPISKTRQIRGSRRLAREKAFQVLVSYYISETPVTELFNHIFFREFNLGENEEHYNKILTQDEILEIESDIPIIWDDMDIQFGEDLILRTIEFKAEIDETIKSITEHWEFDRIAILDRILIEIAATELALFPEIPVKVSINEAIDMAKKYSTEKSKSDRSHVVL